MMIRIGIGITGNGGKGKTGSVIPPSGNPWVNESAVTWVDESANTWTDS